MRAPIIAVDFDGTLTHQHVFPDIGQPNLKVINYVRQFQRMGCTIILWTCREGFLLNEAVKACKSWGIQPNFVNNNSPHIKPNVRKVFADIYIDDKAFNPEYNDLEDVKDFIRNFTSEPWIPLEEIENERGISCSK